MRPFQLDPATPPVHLCTWTPWNNNRNATGAFSGLINTDKIQADCSESNSLKLTEGTVWCWPARRGGHPNSALILITDKWFKSIRNYCFCIRVNASLFSLSLSRSYSLLFCCSFCCLLSPLRSQNHEAIKKDMTTSASHGRIQLYYIGAFIVLLWLLTTFFPSLSLSLSLYLPFIFRYVKMLTYFPNLSFFIYLFLVFISIGYLFCCCYCCIFFKFHILLRLEEREREREREREKEKELTTKKTRRKSIALFIFRKRVSVRRWLTGIVPCFISCSPAVSQRRLTRPFLFGFLFGLIWFDFALLSGVWNRSMNNWDESNWEDRRQQQQHLEMLKRFYSFYSFIITRTHCCLHSWLKGHRRMAPWKN